MIDPGQKEKFIRPNGCFSIQVNYWVTYPTTRNQVTESVQQHELYGS